MQTNEALKGEKKKSPQSGETE
ncbi:hypothetical protein ACOMHN_062893 [Nucella lapillus]